MGAARRLTMATDRVVPNVTCLGCGCACDDIEAVTRGGRIVEARNACPLGVEWFGDGVVPQQVSIAGRSVSLDEAVVAAAHMLSRAVSPLVYLAPDVSWETQREAVALADDLGGALDSVTSATALASLLAAQERGRASATLGEVRNRADVIVFWGVDPGRRYPRFASRYAPEPAGLFIADGRRSRTVIAIDIDDRDHSRGPADADGRIALTSADEVAMLTALTAIVSAPAAAGRRDGLWDRAHDLASALTSAKYVAIVVDGERADVIDGRCDLSRAGALIAFAQALNGRTRCALSTLRDGGNRSGADAVLTWQTGYPVAVDFAHGYPRYRPYDGTARARLGRGEVDAVLVIGAVSRVPSDLTSMMARIQSVVIGPRASESVFAARGIVIDTGVAGIHEEGTALRMDDVPLPLRAVLDGVRGASTITRTVREAIRR